MIAFLVRSRMILSLDGTKKVNLSWVHTAPREIEWYKPPQPGETSGSKAEERAQIQRDLA